VSCLSLRPSTRTTDMDSLTIAILVIGAVIVAFVVASLYRDEIREIRHRRAVRKITSGKKQRKKK
jgi:hypothetical protein